MESMKGQTMLKWLVLAPLVLAVGALFGGWMLMLTVGVIHGEWLTMMPTIGYWSAVKVSFMLSFMMGLAFGASRSDGK
jgi:acyl-CoA hydrolase